MTIFTRVTIILYRSQHYIQQLSLHVCTCHVTVCLHMHSKLLLPAVGGVVGSEVADEELRVGVSEVVEDDSVGGNSI